MSEVNEERVLDALKGIIEPGLGKNIVSLGMVESIKAKCLLWVRSEVRLRFLEPGFFRFAS